MANTPRMNWPFPNENADPWYEQLNAFVQAQDASGYAAREDRQLVLTEGGTVAWDATSSQLSWSADLKILSPITGRMLTVAAGTVTMDDGKVLYTSLVRAPTADATVSVAQALQVPATDQALLLAVRAGTRIYWRNGLMMLDGDSFTTVGASQGGAGTDPDAIHDNVDGEISAIAEKLVPAGADVVVIEDSAASFAKKKVQIANLAGGSPVTSYADISTNAQSAMGATAQEDRIGEVTFDGSKHDVVTFETLVTPTFATTGTVNVRLYDVGPVAGPPTVGRLVATLTTTSDGGPQRLTQTLTVVAAAPTTNEILDSDRMYQVTVEVDATTGDDCYVGSVSLVGFGPGSGGVDTDPTAIHENVPAEISAIAPKVTPTTSDYLLIEDAADSNNKKSITIGALPSGGGTADGRGFAIVIGNSVAGDTSDICDYLDVGDCVQLKAGIEAAAGKPVFIRPGTYDFNAGALTSNEITIPVGTRIVGAGNRAVTIRLLDQAPVEGQFLVYQGGGTTVEHIEISIPTPVALLDSADSGAFIYFKDDPGNVGMYRVRVVFEDDGWSTLADKNYVGLFNLIYSEAGYTGFGSPSDCDNLAIVDCEFVDIPNEVTCPVFPGGGFFQPFGLLGSSPKHVEFKDNFVRGGDLVLEVYGDHTEITGNVMLGAAYNWIVNDLGGDDKHKTIFRDNTIEMIYDPLENQSQFGIILNGFYARVIDGNNIVLSGGTFANTYAIYVGNNAAATVSNNHFNEGSHSWALALDVGANAYGTATGNDFGLSGVNNNSDDFIFCNNTPAGVGQTFTGAQSTLWYRPESPGGQIIEFETDTLTTGGAGETESAGATQGIWHITGNAAGSFSRNTVDVFDTTFTSGTAVRYIESPNSRRSYTFLQAPASGDEFFAWYYGYTFKASEGFPATIYDQVLISRLSFQQRLTPVAGDARVGMFLGRYLGNPTFGPDINNYLMIVLSNTTGGNMLATFQKVDGGTPTVINSTTNVGSEGQALEHAAIVYKQATGEFHGFVGAAGGNWIYLGSTTMTVATLDIAGIYLQNSSVTAPGVAVVGADFIRNFKTDPGVVTANFLF